jgi:dTMP kinase
MLITFEGIDGSGKSTQAQKLWERLQQEGRDPMLVREPGGTLLSERVRTLLLDRTLHVEPFAELLLFSAARTQLVVEIIRPALREGRIVICDRFYDSTVAYQGGGRQLGDLPWLHDFNRRVTGGLVPDRTYLIDMEPAKALARRAHRHAGAATRDDRMEAAGLAFQQRVVEAYLILVRDEPERFLCLDGLDAIETLHTRIWDDFQRLCAREAEPGV